MVLWNDVNLNANESVILELSLLVLRFHRQPEGLIIFELKVHAIFLEVHIEVGLVYAEWAACQLDVFECLLQINAGSSNDIVALKEVTIISLYGKPVVLPWVNFIEL